MGPGPVWTQFRSELNYTSRTADTVRFGREASLLFPMRGEGVAYCLTLAQEPGLKLSMKVYSL